jgi:hypothetical protein
LINVNDCLRWLADEKSLKEYFMIAMTYNPSLKNEILKNGHFNEENIPSDPMRTAEILNQVLNNFKFNEFKVRLMTEKFSWFPDFIDDTDENARKIKSYLDGINWKNKKYLGSFTITNLFDFYQIFYEYPCRYKYQDILMIPDSNDFLIIISHHGELWIISDNKAIMNEMYYSFDKNGATVIKGNTFTEGIKY